MSNEINRISLWLRQQSKLAPSRLKFKVVRDSGVGEEFISDFALHKDNDKQISEAITMDLQAQAGSVKYRIIALGDAETMLASIRIMAKGSAEESSAGFSPVMGKVVSDTFGTVRDHYGMMFGEYQSITAELRSDIARRDDKIEKLENDLQIAWARISSLTAKLEVDTEAQIGQAKVQLYQKLADKVDDAVVIAQNLLSPKKGPAKELPAPSVSQIAEFRAACSGLSDDSIVKLMRSMYDDHLDVCASIIGLLRPEEQKSLHLPVKRILEGSQ
jgi:hypothetical protein